MLTETELTWVVLIATIWFFSGILCSIIVWGKTHQPADAIGYFLLGLLFGPLWLFSTIGLKPEIIGPCPYCETGVKIPATLAGFDCPACAKRVIVRGTEFAQLPGHGAP